MPKYNVFYAQSGGVTAVINASACGVIETARAMKADVGKVYAGRNGILGALTEDLIDTSKETSATIAALKHTPGGAFGSCRYKLQNPETSIGEYERLIEVFKAHNIRYFLYNGGGDSADTCLKVANVSQWLGYPIHAIHIPKTVDNDLPHTDNSPGFGSAAKYVVTSIKEASMDVASMAATSTKIFILEVMGRHAGWIAAAAGVAAQQEGDAPHIILLPEVPFQEAEFLAKVKESVERYGHCAIVASEGARYANGDFLAQDSDVDVFGHTQLGGMAPTLARMIRQKLGYKYHWAVADYLQRSARHIASAVDVDQAYAAGRVALQWAIQGKNGVMPGFVRGKGKRYSWKIESVNLEDVANVEKTIPREFISEDGFSITEKAKEYFLPLIKGESYPPYKNGIPVYARLKNLSVTPKLPPYVPG